MILVQITAKIKVVNLIWGYIFGFGPLYKIQVYLPVFIKSDKNNIYSCWKIGTLYMYMYVTGNILEATKVSGKNSLHFFVWNGIYNYILYICNRFAIILIASKQLAWLVQWSQFLKEKGLPCMVTCTWKTKNYVLLTYYTYVQFPGKSDVATWKWLPYDEVMLSVGNKST